MSTDPDQIRADIERTRAELSSDVDALEQKVSPSNIAHRQAEKVRSRATSLKERVMGTAGDARGAVSGTAHGAASSVGSGLSSAGETVKDLPHTVARQAEGNPLAAGVIAFGIGWLASSLLPSSRKEQQAAGVIKDKAGVLADEAKQVAAEAAEHLKEPAQQAAQAVRETATEAAGALKEQGQSAAADVRGQAQDAAHTVQDQHGH